jgi:hypothetical protein
VRISVLLVEDNADDMRQFLRDFPGFFAASGIEAEIDAQPSFEDAISAAKSATRRFDLIISDTFRGAHANKDAAVLEMIAEYRNGKFAPLVVCSSAPKPAEVVESPFVRWADKGKVGDIPRVLRETFDTGIPQLSRRIHDEIDRSAGGFLWEFLDSNWAKLKSTVSAKQLDRIVRRRAALMLGDLDPDQDHRVPLEVRHSSEYYIYPAFAQTYFSLGDVVRSKADGEFRVILTPHCFLVPRKTGSGALPKAEYVLTVGAVGARDAIGKEAIENAKKIQQEEAKLKKLAGWARNNIVATPEGRYWFLPAFLDIPHLYCDFLRAATLDQATLKDNFVRIATLTPPYAESLQENFATFYGSVGIPDIDPSSIGSLLE